MKQLILPFFMLLSYGSQAQLSIVPTVGVDMFRTALSQGNLPSFSPLGNQFAPSLAVRMAYKLKSGQGAFVGVSTSSPATQLTFTDPDNAQKMYTAAAGALQLRFEGGYQFTSKPITLKKATNTAVVPGSSFQRSSSTQ